jgi:Ni/Co efflux regulator RcnB
MTADLVRRLRDPFNACCFREECIAALESAAAERDRLREAATRVVQELVDDFERQRRWHSMKGGDDYPDSRAVARAREFLAGRRVAERCEVRNNDDGTLDEVVGYGYFHLEQMDTGHWWLGIGDSEILHVNLHSRGKIAANVIDERPAALSQSERT